MTPQERYERIEKLYRQAIELDPPQREAFLERQCEADAELVAQVRSLLRQEGTPTEALVGAVAHTQVDVQATVRSAVGTYRILEPIGEGGFAVVYLAEQERPLRRRVALKVIKPGMDSKQVIGRFEAERQALALLDHPNVAKVLDAGATDAGGPYFVMEYVPGIPITTYCDRETLSIEERLGLFQQVCRGVQHAHQKAILHRDLKPGNVLVMSLDGKATAKIIDFGVAKATAQRLTELTLYTEVGQIVGTPEYMSPEQVEATAVDIDTRADVYSLGVLLYELLTGHVPFDPQTLRRAGHAEMQRIIREVDPPRPSTRFLSLGDESTLLAQRRQTDLRTLLSQLRGDLDWITMKALAKERARRYGSASDLAADLYRYLRHVPVEARPPSAVYLAKKFLRRNRAPVTAAAMVVVALVAGLSWALVERARAEEAAQTARAEAERADREADAARASAALAERNERLALEEKTRADEALSRVLRLSDVKLVADYAAEVDGLWPANPGKIAALEAWLGKARDLYERLPVHEAELAALRQRALPRSAEEAAAERASHPRLPELEAAQGRVAWLKRTQDIRQGRQVEPTPAPDWKALPGDAKALNELAWPLVDPARKSFGDEARALMLARRAADLAPQEAAILDTLAWALLANGLDAEAKEASRRALASAREEERQQYEGQLEMLQSAITEIANPEWLPGELGAAEQQAQALEEEVSARRSWRFEDASEQWQHQVLAELVKRLATFEDPRTGAIAGVGRRLEFARTIEDRSITSAEARAAWAAAIASISDPHECSLYGGLLIKPQVGLLPLGRDPQSGLWEFWHIQTGARPQENPQWPQGAVNRWTITGETGLVLVLIPGGTFRMGAEQPRLGVNTEETPEGVRVTAVDSGTLAERMGLQVGDILRAVDGAEFGGRPTLAEAQRRFLSGATVTAAVLRGGSAFELAATVERGIDSPNVDPDAASEESPVHDVTLDPFFLSKYEMTQGQWLRFVGENPSYYAAGRSSANTRIVTAHPVEQVSWNAVDGVLRKLALALPTEAQWEYACRAGTGSTWHTGAEAGALLGHANIADEGSARFYAAGWNFQKGFADGFDVHAPVGSFSPNGFGLHDMHGNLWEWCRDWYVGYGSPPRAGDGLRDAPDVSHRVIRGGSFGYPAVVARSAYRHRDAPGFRGYSAGLRPSRVITE